MKKRDTRKNRKNQRGGDHSIAAQEKGNEQVIELTMLWRDKLRACEDEKNELNAQHRARNSRLAAKVIELEAEKVALKANVTELEAEKVALKANVTEIGQRRDYFERNWNVEKKGFRRYRERGYEEAAERERRERERNLKRCRECQALQSRTADDQVAVAGTVAAVAAERRRERMGPDAADDPLPPPPPLDVAAEQRAYPGQRRVNPHQVGHPDLHHQQMDHDAFQKAEHRRRQWEQEKADEANIDAFGYA